MKHLLIALIAAALLLAGFACAEEPDDSYLGDMTVVNCSDFVSLRAQPSTKADRIAKVTLGDIVYNCQRYNDEFIYCEYEGMEGYILADYLEPVGGNSDAVLNVVLEGYHVLAERTWIGEGEYLLVTCEDDAGEQLWFYETMTSYVTELTLTDAFIGGPAQDPMVMVYNSEKGLVALDIVSGETRWTLTPEQVQLGGSVSHAVDGDGTVYIGGFYGPDPVAISADGEVLWQSMADSNDVFWLYEIELRDGNVAAHYDTFYEMGQDGWLLYSAEDGSLLGAAG